MARKKHPTYDSKETLTVLGIGLLVLALFLLLSQLSSDTDTSIFGTAKGVFGTATFVAVFVSFNFSLRFLGIDYIFNTARSLIVQAILLFTIPAFMTAMASGPLEIYRYAGNSGETLGGQIGYFVVVNIMQETLPTQPATKLILFIVNLVLIPLALAIPSKMVFEYLSLILKGIWSFLKRIWGTDDDLEEEEDDMPQNAATFGDFNKVLKKKRDDMRAQKDEEADEKKAYSEFNIPKRPTGSNTAITEGAIGEDGLRQDDLKYPNWKLPPLSLLVPAKKSSNKEPAIEQNARIIEQTLVSFGIEAKVEESYVGPSVIQYALNIPLGVKVEKISNLSANIALALGVDSKAVRIESIPETTYLGIEVPRENRDKVRFKELMSADNMMNTTMGLPVPVGKDIDGSAVIVDIQKLPHLLIAGATGSGKSVLTNSFISSLLMKKTPDEVKFILVDPKQVELSDYNGIPHLLTPVITDMDKVVNALKWAVNEMERRYTNLAKEQVRNILGYNEKLGFSAMPYIVIVIDEMADMMMTANRVEAETAIVRLAQKARAVGIHLILATQRPSVNVITGIIKANIPGRVGMSVTSSTDSRVILDRIGSESLLGYGDLLYKAPDKPKAARLQGSLIEQEEVIRIVNYIRSQAPEVEYVNEIVEKQAVPGEDNDGFMMDGSMMKGSQVEQAIRLVVQFNKGSSSFLQRKMNIGFNKAAELIEELEGLGVVGQQNGSKPREVLVSDAETFIQDLKNNG
jgi:DNA segregation ATPase FtsK/SpoIIIE-like protein